MLREDGRKFNEERKIKITKDVNIYAEGSVLIEVGNTKVICTASVSEKVPPFLRGTGKGGLLLNTLCCLELQMKEIKEKLAKVN